MMLSTPLRALVAAALGATTVAAANGTTQKVLIGGGPTGMVGAADFDGKSFKIVANDTIAGTSASWMLFKEPNLLYAVDENSNTTRLFNVSRPVLFWQMPPTPRTRAHISPLPSLTRRPMT